MDSSGYLSSAGDCSVDTKNLGGENPMYLLFYAM